MIKENKKTILIAGGGTGGHLFPAIAIGNGLEAKKIMVHYIGSKFGIEKKFFKKSNLEYNLINIKGIQRSFTLKSLLINLTFPFRFIIAYFQSLRIILYYKPLAIIGTGGYCSGLPLIVAHHLKIPTFIQDQNSTPGLITRKLKNKINKIFLAYENAAMDLNTNNCRIFGNPLRDDLKRKNIFSCKRKFKLDENKKTILILGGSQGATPINMHIFNNINFYLKNDIQILWQCGEKDYKKLSKMSLSKNIIIKPFIKNMSEAYSASDLVISRAGAITISELTFMNKAMVLIPYIYAADNHQLKNAQFLENNKACILIKQDELKTGILENKIIEILDNNSILEELKNYSSKMAMPNATSDITKEIIDSIS